MAPGLAVLIEAFGVVAYLHNKKETKALHKGKRPVVHQLPREWKTREESDRSPSVSDTASVLDAEQLEQRQIEADRRAESRTRANHGLGRFRQAVKGRFSERRSTKERGPTATSSSTSDSTIVVDPALSAKSSLAAEPDNLQEESYSAEPDSLETLSLCSSRDSSLGETIPDHDLDQDFAKLARQGSDPSRLSDSRSLAVEPAATDQTAACPISENTSTEDSSKDDPAHQSLLTGKQTVLRLSLQAIEYSTSAPKHLFSLRLTLANRVYSTRPLERTEDVERITKKHKFEFHLGTQAWLFGILKVDLIEHVPSSVSLPGLTKSSRERVWGRSLIHLSCLELHGEKARLERSFELKKRQKRSHGQEPALGSLTFRFEIVTPQDEPMGPPGEVHQSDADADDTDTKEQDEQDMTVKRLPWFIHYFMPKSAKNVVTELSVLYHAFFGTGWRMSKSEVYIAYNDLEKYWRYQEPQQRHSGRFVSDEKFLVDSQRLLRMSIACYGAFALHFHGIGFWHASRNLIRWHSDKVALCNVFKLGKDDILKWHFDSSDPSTPHYYICIDKQASAIVIAIRGTFNVMDVITDINAGYVPYEQGLVHGGIYQSGQYIVKHDLELIKQSLEAFGLNRVLTCGHSLGGGVSTIAAVLLQEALAEFRIKRNDQFLPVEVKGFSFAGPPTMSYTLSQKYEDLISTFVNDSDIVPAASYGTAIELKNLFKVITETRRKQEVRTLSKHERDCKIREAIDEERKNLLPLDSKTKLFLPGKVYFFLGGYNIVPGTGNAVAAPRYTRDVVCEIMDARSYNEMVIRRNFLFTHMPDAYDYHFDGSRAFIEACQVEKESAGVMVLRGGSLLQWQIEKTVDV